MDPQEADVANLNDVWFLVFHIVESIYMFWFLIFAFRIYMLIGFIEVFNKLTIVSSIAASYFVWYDWVYWVLVRDSMINPMIFISMVLKI